MSTDYSNREIDGKFTAMHESIDTKHESIMTMLKDIKEQTTKTNGRVSALENWRSGIVAVIAFLSFLIPIALTLASK